MKEPEHEGLKEKLKRYELWDSARLFIIGLIVQITSKIVGYFDFNTATELYAIAGLCYLGGIMLAGPVRKQWDNKYKGK